MITAEKKYLSPEEYLRIERDAVTKSEYYKGEMFAMSVASLKHNIITSNLMFQFLLKLRDTEYFVFGSDMRINVSQKGLFTYPDISIIKGEVELYDDFTDTILNPILLIEVLSKSTQSYDRGGKFDLYKNIKTLKEYILVSQDEVSIQHFQIQNETEWTLTEFKNKESEIILNSIDCCISVNDVYLKIGF